MMQFEEAPISSLCEVKSFWPRGLPLRGVVMASSQYSRAIEDWFQGISRSHAPACWSFPKNTV